MYLRLGALNRPLLSLSQFSSGIQRSGLLLNQRREVARKSVRRIKGKISTLKKIIKKSLLSHTVNTITCHSPFRDHLALIELTDEPICPKCGANTDSQTSTFIFDCIYCRKIRKKSLNIESKQKNTQNQSCITVTDLAGYIKLSEWFDTNYI